MDFESCSQAPEFWKRLTIEEVCTRITSGGTPSRRRPEFFINGTVPWVKTQELQDGWIRETEEKITEEALISSSAKLLPPNTVMLAMYGATVGQLGILESSMTCNQACCALIIDKYIADFRYVYYLLRLHREAIKGLATGAAQQNLSAAQIKRFKFAFPDLETQTHIADVLSALDDKIDLNRRINQTLEAMAQAIFKSWFVDFDPVKAKIAAIEQGEDPLRAAMRAISGKTDAELDQMPREHHDQLAATAALFPDAMEESELGEIPKGWEVSDFGSVSVCFDKNRIPLSKRQREDKKGNIPYYGATSVMDYVDEHIFDGVFLLLGEDGSVLREDGTPFVQYIWGKSWVNNHAHVLQGANGVSTEQLMLFISMQNISAYVTGAVQLKLNQKNMNSMPFIKAEENVNSRFSELITPLYAKYRSLFEEIRGLTELRDSLLPKLLSGELSAVETKDQVTP